LRNPRIDFGTRDELDRESRRQLDFLERKIVAPRERRAQDRGDCDRRVQAAQESPFARG
jgi:hypothetical protein